MTDGEDAVGKSTRELANKMIEKGLLIEGGFEVFRVTAIPKNTPQIQIDEMKLAWMTSAQHLFSTFIGILEDSDLSEDDRRMALIHRELAMWEERIMLRINPAEGSS